jgi:cbb3-type cytochrome oxidase subunit 3
MKNLIRKYKELSFEQKTIIKTILGLCFSAILASGKFVIGLFTDYNMISIAVYTSGILLAKLECVLGAKSNKLTFKQRNILVAFFLFLSSVFYIGFMCRMFFIERRLKNNSMIYVLLLAFISFVELGFAIAGLLRIKNKGHLYRNIKIINFCIALVAILTTQMAILNMTSETDVVSIANAYTGIGIGIFIALCAVYILFAPKISIIDRENNVFELKDETKNKLINMENDTAEIPLCRSKVYGSYIYCATIANGQVNGNIERGTTLWKHMHILLKILCCILSEILLFVWLIGRLIFMFRSINLPRRLENKMSKNGFEKINCQDKIQTNVPESIDNTIIL